MKIISSSKIDDYRKTILDDSVLKAINAKPGDSILFYRRDGESSVCIHKAEGAYMTSECDSPHRNHMRGAFNNLRAVLMICTVMAALVLMVAILNYGSFSGLKFLLLIIPVILVIAGLCASIFISQSVDRPFDTQSLATVGGPYSKNRLKGISRLTSDGYIITGDLFINSLFGSNPSSIDVKVDLDDGESIIAVTKLVKSVTGYSIYRIRFKEGAAAPGSMNVTAVYTYSGKSITVLSSFDLGISEDGTEIVVTEGNVEAKFEFDSDFNSTAYDDALFDPTEEGA